MIEEIEELNEMIFLFQEEVILNENKKMIEQLNRNGVKIRVHQTNLEAS